MCGNQTSKSIVPENDFGGLKNQSYISILELIDLFRQPNFRQKLVKKVELEKTSFETPSSYYANQWATVWTSSRSVHTHQFFKHVLLGSIMIRILMMGDDLFTKLRYIVTKLRLTSHNWKFWFKLYLSFSMHCIRFR